KLSGVWSQLPSRYQLDRHRDRFVVIDDVDALYADRSGVRLLKWPVLVEILGWIVQVVEPDHEDRLPLVEPDGLAPGVVHRELQMSLEPRVDVEARDVHQAAELDPGADRDESDGVR